MIEPVQGDGAKPQPQLSRRSLLRQTAALATATVGGAETSRPRVAAGNPPHAPAPDDAPLKPVDALRGMLAALADFPLVALAERHTLQEWHDFVTALLFHPELPGRITDIVVEFGNSRYQDVADRFVLEGRPVANAELKQIWRQIGDPSWNAPVYEQFFHTVRAVNWMRPPRHRIRVLLGQTPITMSQVIASPKDRALSRRFTEPLDAHYAALVEREVMAKGRRALLTAGGGHMLRGIHRGSNDQRPNAATLLAERHRGKLYVVDLLIMPPGRQREEQARRLQDSLARWPRPALAKLAGTWLGAATAGLAGGWVNAMAYRAIDATSARYERQADAVLYLGPAEALTASRPDPAIYQAGSYAAELRRLDPILAPGGDPKKGPFALGVKWAQAGPSWFER
jgi:hypothetical protein